MQEPHVEDVANHNDPESCGAHCEVHVEALTGGNAGQPLSFEIYLWCGNKGRASNKGCPLVDQVSPPTNLRTGLVSASNLFLNLVMELFVWGK